MKVKGQLDLGAKLLLSLLKPIGEQSANREQAEEEGRGVSETENKEYHPPRPSPHSHLPV